MRRDYARMPIEEFREHIETVRDPAVVNQWLEKMKQVMRYTWKPAAEGETAAVFDQLDEARAHLLATARNRMVKAVESARFHAKLLETLPPGEIYRAVEGQLERQRRFPLDTANALRGRLRREGFTIFKKGAKGVSYVCAVKRKFRVPGQSFAEGINVLITFLEANPMILVKELPVKLLGITPPATGSTPPMPVLSMSTPPMAPSTPPMAPPAAEPSAAAPAPAPAEPAVAPPPPAMPPPVLTPEEQEKLRRMTMDLRWLVQEGYVTEFADGRLFAPPPMVEAHSKLREAAEGEEPDLESFPEAPGAAEPAADVAASSPEAPAPSPAVETPGPAAGETAAPRTAETGADPAPAGETPPA